MRKFLILMSLTVPFGILSSCSQKYDWATMDKHVTVGGDEFVFPLGHTSVNGLKVDSLMPNFSSIEELKKDDDGNYYFDYAGSEEREISLEGFRDSLNVKRQSEKLKIQKGTPTEIPQEGCPFEFDITNVDTASFDYDLSGAKKEGLVRLDSIQFKNARISVRGGLSCSGVDKLDPSIKLIASLSIPPRFHINDPRVKNHILMAESYITPVTGKADSATIDFKSVDFSVADFLDPDSIYVFTDSVRLNSLRIYIKNETAFNTIKDKEVKVYLSVELEGGEKGSAYDLEPEIVYGLLDVKADTVERMLDITGIPDYMRNGVLDLSNPLIRLNLTSNSSVPIRVASDFLSLNLEERALAETKVELINKNVTENPTQIKSTDFVISNRRLEGEFEWVYGDIDTLVYTLPKALFVTLDPRTYLGDSTSFQHRIHLGDNLKMNIAYNFTLPLQFGPSLLMSFRDTITGMPDLLREVMEKNDIYFVGNTSSTMPANMSFYFRMLDENGKDLGIESGKGEIPGTDDPSAPEESDYRVKVDASSNAGKISKMEIQFIMEDGSENCLNEDNYVKMDIRVAVPGGIELEIKD